MRKYLFLAAAATVVATPAVARDGSMYVGIEAGPMLVENTRLDFVDNDDDIEEAFVFNHKLGIDAGLIAGYDWGAFRTELELAYKRASMDEIALGPFLGDNPGGHRDADGSVRVLSGMANVLLDFGDENGWSAYVGPGIGLATVRYNTGINEPIVAGRGFDMRAEDRVLAWQVIAGIRTALTQNIDLGLKYRFFNAPGLEFDEDEGGGVNNPPFSLDGRYRSHSLLASLVYNFYTPPPPPPVYAPPPPPPPPATKTCPDGSVVLATDPCPLPPPPPPPPPPLPERG